jgi:hypothetical protein
VEAIPAMIVVTAMAIPARIHRSGGVRVVVSATGLVKSVLTVESEDTDSSGSINSNWRANLQSHRMKALRGCIRFFRAEF